MKGSLMLSLESTGSRMANLARQEMYFGRFFSLDELLESIECVTAADVQCISLRLSSSRSRSRLRCWAAWTDSASAAKTWRAERTGPPVALNWKPT